MLEQIGGLPLHPLLIHAAVVFVPLLALASLAYALVPGLRARIWWAVGLLALAGAGSAVLARFSGVAFKARLIRKHLASPQILDKVSAHQHFGNMTMYVTLALAAVTLLSLWLVGRQGGNRVVQAVNAVVVVILAVVTVYYCYRAGDSAARIVWAGY